MHFNCLSSTFVPNRCLAVLKNQILRICGAPSASRGFPLTRQRAGGAVLAEEDCPYYVHQVIFLLFLATGIFPCNFVLLLYKFNYSVACAEIASAACFP